MDLAKAIETAIQFETKVRDTYVEAGKKATDEKGRRIFAVLAEEEQGHLSYLKSRLEEWQKTGALTPKALKTVIPAKKTIEEGVKKLKQKVKKSTTSYAVELDMLRRALEVEIETGSFYKRMVNELDASGKAMFARFVEIEEGHQAIVKAEIDAVSGFGFWFDTPEFRLENA